MYVIGIDPTQVWTSTQTPDFKVGQRGKDAAGNEYILFKSDATGVTQYHTAILTTADDVAVMASTTSSAPGLGQGMPCVIAQATVAANGFGWGLVNGVGLVRVAASCAAATQLNTTATAGQLDDDATAGAEVINGIGLIAARAASAGTANALITYPTVGRTL